MAREYLIVEGIVTTVGEDSQVNIAPMGAHVDRSFRRISLRPYQSSQTFKNLQHHPEGVFHVVDDVLLLAQAAVGQISPAPILLMAEHIKNGYVLRDSCRFYEFKVEHINASQERADIDISVVWDGRIRDHFGFNRAMFAVVEASILATRVKFLPREQIEQELTRLQPLVEKTGSRREREAFDFLKNYIATAPRDAAPESPEAERAEGPTL